MKKATDRKKELDNKRTEWRKKHRTLKGRVILYPNKPPEHINSRASKTYNWFWKKTLLSTKTQDIPAIISFIKGKISAENDTKKIRMYRTMIGMAEDAYQLKTLDEIENYDPELQLDNSPVYNSELGLIYKDGKIFTTDYNEDETSIIIRDMEGVIVDIQNSSVYNDAASIETMRNNNYKNWNYMEKK